ncbi:hypothetical protein HPG69_014032, partial [Diceros bicornis minor]
NEVMQEEDDEAHRRCEGCKHQSRLIPQISEPTSPPASISPLNTSLQTVSGDHYHPPPAQYEQLCLLSMARDLAANTTGWN